MKKISAALLPPVDSAEGIGALGLRGPGPVWASATEVNRQKNEINSSD